MAPTQTRQQEGFTLVELVISATVLVMLMYMVSTLAESGNDAHKYGERITRVTEITQSIVDDMRRELTSSVRLFPDDADGNGYVGLLDSSGFPTRLASSLPALDSSGIFEQETSTAAKTGNQLAFARHAWRTEFTTTAGRSFRIDVYRLVDYYLAAEGAGPQPGSAIGLNLVKWVSEPLADGYQIDGIADATDRAEVCMHLLNATPDDDGVVHPAVEVVWLRNDPPLQVGTLRQIQTAGTLNTSPPASRGVSWTILPDVKMSSQGLLFYRHHSVVTNYAPSTYGIGRFSVVDNTGDGFPHGFEVQMIGPASARQVLLRLLVVSTNNHGHHAHAVLQTIADCRDL